MAFVGSGDHNDFRAARLAREMRERSAENGRSLKGRNDDDKSHDVILDRFGPSGNAIGAGVPVAPAAVAIPQSLIPL